LQEISDIRRFDFST